MKPRQVWEKGLGLAPGCALTVQDRTSQSDNPVHDAFDANIAYKAPSGKMLLQAA